SWVSCRGSNHAEKFTNPAKTEKEHKENVPPFSMGDEAEPRVGMGTPKLPFGTGLCHFFCSMAQLCATCFESVRVRFDFQHFIFSVQFFSKKESFFIGFYFFLVVRQPKRGASMWRHMAFLMSSTWRHLDLFRDITQT